MRTIEELFTWQWKPKHYVLCCECGGKRFIIYGDRHEAKCWICGKIHDLSAENLEYSLVNSLDGNMVPLKEKWDENGRRVVCER